MSVENEVKLRLTDIEAAKRRIAELGYSLLHARVYEVNRIFDGADLPLRRKRSLLRLRTAGQTTTVTFKGPPQQGPHKTREEIEFTASSADAVEAVLTRLGLENVFRYEKYRTEFARPGAAGVITLDETPIGSFLELEGEPAWLDATARDLGFSPADYVTDSYGGLYQQYCRQHGTASRDMVFGGTK